MIDRKVKIINPLGLHARPAARFAKLASQFKSQIVVMNDEVKVNAKSIMSLLMLAAGYGSEIIIQASGEDEEEAVESLSKLVEDGFGEI